MLFLFLSMVKSFHPTWASFSIRSEYPKRSKSLRHAVMLLPTTLTGSPWGFPTNLGMSPTLELKVRNFRSTKLGINLQQHLRKIQQPFNSLHWILMTGDGRLKTSCSYVHSFPPLIDTKVVLPSHDDQAAVLIKKKIESREGADFTSGGDSVCSSWSRPNSGKASYKAKKNYLQQT